MCASCFRVELARRGGGRQGDNKKDEERWQRLSLVNRAFLPYSVFSLREIPLLGEGSLALGWSERGGRFEESSTWDL